MRCTATCTRCRSLHRAAHAVHWQLHVTQLQVMSICQMALSKGVEALVLCVNQGVNIPPRHTAQGNVPATFQMPKSCCV